MIQEIKKIYSDLLKEKNIEISELKLRLRLKEHGYDVMYIKEVIK